MAKTIASYSSRSASSGPATGRAGGASRRRGDDDTDTTFSATGTVSVTPEAIIAAAPEVIVTTSEGLEALGGVTGLLDIPGFAETPAGRDGRILGYPEGDFLTFGPRIGESLQLLIADLRAGPGGS